MCVLLKAIELNLHESSPTILSERKVSAVHSSNTASLPDVKIHRGLHFQRKCCQSYSAWAQGVKAIA